MKKILVPTDFSEQAENALKVAAQLALKHDAEIYLLHMLEIPLQKVDARNSHSSIPEAVFFMKLAHKHFKEVMSKDYLKDIKVYEMVKFQEEINQINKTCEELDIDIIVMGSHGASGLKEMFVGSHAEKVVRTSKVPVLVIKKEHPEFKVNDFVFASDFKEDNRKTYTQATNLAKAWGSKIHLVLINTAGNFITSKKAEERILDFISGNDFDNYSINIYNDKNIEKGVLNFSNSIDTDLIGISTHGRQGIAHFFSGGSISEDLVNHATRPVITFKI